ncbi:GNAT family N-acetyltransferase [Neobacillus terrae]|uniref:GNAT family N-acetyltransferase n=1 Tax=Neobacillus terrae TaxID=3034837 RepID=UPI00140D8E6D|nr:GNAT family N-acetyltransferase [Neobacillus terrae]NHM29880.1 GNAT family N-acetyltransferase [Neobacillus terrae]
MAFAELETKRLRLIELKKKHAPELFEILSIEKVTRFYGTDPFVSENDAVKLIEMFQNNYSEQRGIRWGLELKENGKLMGTAGLNACSFKHKRAEVGYEIHPNYWRKGYANEAIKEILDYSIVTLGFSRIGAIVYPENKPSWQLLEKLGFKREGLLRSYMFQNQKSQDVFGYSILALEWK